MKIGLRLEYTDNASNPTATVSMTQHQVRQALQLEHPQLSVLPRRLRAVMVEKNPWWRNCPGPYPKWDGPIGCKEDGGGCHRGQGLVGKMLIHRAVNNHDADGKRAVSDMKAKTRNN